MSELLAKYTNDTEDTEPKKDAPATVIKHTGANNAAPTTAIKNAEPKKAAPSTAIKSGRAPKAETAKKALPHLRSKTPQIPAKTRGVKRKRYASTPSHAPDITDVSSDALEKENVPAATPLPPPAKKRGPPTVLSPRTLNPRRPTVAAKSSTATASTAATRARLANAPAAGGRVLRKRN